MTQPHITLADIDFYNVEAFAETADFEAMTLKQLADVWVHLVTLCWKAKNRYCNFKAEVRGRFVFESDSEGYFRGMGYTKADIIKDIRHTAEAVTSNRKAHTGRAIDNVAAHIRRMAHIANALTITLERIELRVLKGELAAA